MDEVAIEPTSAAPDALDVAVRQWKRHGTVAPGETAPVVVCDGACGGRFLAGGWHALKGRGERPKSSRAASTPLQGVPPDR